MVTDHDTKSEPTLASPRGGNGSAPPQDNVPERDAGASPEPEEARGDASGVRSDASSKQTAKADAAAKPPLAAAPASAPWQDELSLVALSFFGWLSRPRVRLTVTGVALLLTGGLIVTNSVWTLPLVIAGVLMVVIAWIGGRIEGRLAVQWGETGTELEFRARIKAAESAPAGLLQQPSSSRALVSTLDRDAEAPEIIDGEAHTVEIDVAELKALISAAELTDAGAAPTDAAAGATRTLRVARGGARSSDAAR